MIPESVKRVLDRHGLSALEFEAGSTPTAESAAARIGVEVGQIAKSILMRGKDGVYRMFVVAGDRKISSSKVKRLAGCKHSMTGAEETREVTGFLPSAVCPFGVSGVEIFIDKSLEPYGTVYPAAGTDASGVPTSYDTLLGITDASESDVTAD